MRSRLWNIVLHVHSDSFVTVRAHVDARLLLPICESQSAEQALQYSDAVLVDWQPKDQLSLRVQGVDSGEGARFTDAQRAQVWLYERTALMLKALATSEAPAREDEGSGARSIFTEAQAVEAAERGRSYAS